MYVKTAKLTFYIPYAMSLKDKRHVCRSLVDKAQHKFNAAIAEVDTQDILQTLTIGIAVLSGESSHAKETLETIINFMDKNTDAELVEIEE